MFRIFFLLFFFVGFAYSPPLFSWEKELSLQKEQLYSADVNVGSVTKPFKFRWTLFKNEGLVLHISYDKFNHQVILYKDYQRNSFKIPLGLGEDDLRDVPKLLLYFKDFNDKSAYFKLYIEGLGAFIENENL